MNITPEIRQAIERSGGEPLRLEDPLSRETYILLKESAFERIQRLLAPLISKSLSHKVNIWGVSSVVMG